MAVIGAAFWYLIMVPQSMVPEMRAQEAATLRENVQQQEERLLELNTIATDYSSYTDQATALNGRIPQALEQYSLETQLTSLASTAGLPGSSVSVSISGSMKPLEGIGGGQVYAADATITVTASAPNSLMEYANALHDAERAITIKSMNITGPNAENPLFVLTVQGTVYAAPSIATNPATPQTQDPIIEDTGEPQA